MWFDRGIRLDKALLARVKRYADLAGYASVDEFVAHVLEGRSYREILGTEPHRGAAQPALRHGVDSTEEGLAVATRRVLRLLRTEIQAILREDGIPESGLESEINRMVEGLGP